VVLRDLATTSVADPATGSDLRAGTWTRLGGSTVLGDRTTEATLETLAERTRAAARAQGYAAGWAEGRRRALDDAQSTRAAQEALAATERVAQLGEQDRLVAALLAAAEQARADFDRRYDALAGQALDLALRIAEEVLQREVGVADDAGADALRRALAPVDPRVTVTVRLNPADHDRLDPGVLEGRPVTVVADPGVARGDAVAETDDGLVDATVSGALARVREVLGR
jgi:flagellar assembly protein FliH